MLWKKVVGSGGVVTMSLSPAPSHPMPLANGDHHGDHQETSGDAPSDRLAPAAQAGDDAPPPCGGGVVGRTSDGQNGFLKPLPPAASSPSPSSSSSSAPAAEDPPPPSPQPAPLPPCCQGCPLHPPLFCACSRPEPLPLYRHAAGLPRGAPHPGLDPPCPCCRPALPHQQALWHQQLHPHPPPLSYAELIADWPVVVLGVCTVLIVICALVGVLGFEPRGTAIGRRLVTWNNMLKNTGYRATLANYPFKYADEQARSRQEERRTDDHFDRDKRQAEWDFSKDTFFCDVPGPEVLLVRSHPLYSSLCQRTSDASCCPSWTLGNYVAMLTNRSSCQKITDRDVNHTLRVLRSCAKFYHNGTLGPDCWDMATRRKDQLKCANVPRKCTKYNAVYQILHFLVDKDFLSTKSLEAAPPQVLTHSLLFSPTERGDTMMSIYLDNFENWNASDGVTAVTGIEFGIKHSLFQDYLLTDTVYPAIAVVIVLGGAELSETVAWPCSTPPSPMFVTSFTTAAAFYANYVSNITAIRCFGVYAGTAILVNYILMVTWLPAVVVLHERYLPSVFPPPCAAPPAQRGAPGGGGGVVFGGLAVPGGRIGASRGFFEKVLPCVVIRLRYLWLLSFLALTVGGAYVVCVDPRMKLPSLELAEFQVFRSSHPFERYDADFKKAVHNARTSHMPITIVWGRDPRGQRRPSRPKNKGRLVLDGAFDIASPASQPLGCSTFCQKLRNQSFVFQSEEQDFTSCFMGTFQQVGPTLGYVGCWDHWGVGCWDPWVMENRDCEETSVVYPCCSQSSFPYRREIFELCIKRAIMELDRNTVYHLDSKTPGAPLRHQRHHPRHRLGHGWFISNLEFYDLQDSLSGGTLVAMALSVGVAFSVMLLTTWNVIISLYAILSIAGTIFVTVGSLVLLGWELNVLESVTISVAVGLSVDFAVHYGVAYRLAPQPDREGKVVFSLSRMGSAIAMAALTTFVAGAMMMPSTVLAYTQLGTFMMLIMCVSWAFATFFFQCLCRCLGPQGSCGQIPVPSSMGCGVLAQGPAGAPPAQEGKGPPGPGRYQLGGRGAAEAEHYELEPLASDQRKDGEEPCPRPSNGLVDLRHAPRVFVARETGPCACSHGPQRGPGPRTPADPHATRPAPEALCPAQECCLQYVRQPHLHHQPCFGPAGGPETPGPCRACRPSRSQTDSACAGCDCSCCGERPSTSPTNEGEAARTGGEDTPPGVPLLQDTPLLQGHTHRDTRSEPAASPRNLGCFKRRLKVKSPSAPKVEGAAAPRPSHATATSETSC
ncbi:hypothetical protein CRUP_000661 [Coryphaenoides rupestris]|nr:hypothetical protein CRUP_000661 [Coryphaenoides rupestris]